MAIPSPIKIRKNSVEYISNVERTKYAIVELQRSALRDVGKFLRKRVIQEMRKLPGMKKSRRPARGTQTWVRKRETDLQIGFGNTKKDLSGDTWYLIQQELGTKNQPARHILRSTVYGNIPEIIHIESKYLSSLEDEALALAMIDEEDEGEGDEND